jgi:flagellar M-ring protein FliF
MALLPVDSRPVIDAQGRIASVLNGFTTGQKVLTVAAAAAVVIGGFLFVSAESSPSYSPLFTNLQAADAGAVTSQLTSAKIPYQLSDGGSTVSVPASDVDQERIALAQQGLPQGGDVGFSTLEKGGITTSDFVQQVEYQQALEGQLAQTFEGIEGVRSAQVNLVVPTQSSFAVDNQPATTASIVVDLTPGTVLSSGQVSAIVHLAASSVPGLTTDNVTLVDNHGDVLNAPGQVGGDGSGSSTTEMTNAYDQTLASQLTSMLALVVGPGNAAVQVHALLDFDQTQTTTNGLQLDPTTGQPVVAPTQTSNSSSTGSNGSTGAGGVLGATQTTTGTTSGGGNSTNTSSQVTNAVGQVTQTVTQAPGKPVTTSVAVLLDQKAAAHVSTAQVTQLVTAAAGLKPANGDQLVVSTLPFATVPAPAPVAAASQLIPEVEKIGGLLLLIGALLFIALRSSKKRRLLYQEIPMGELTEMVQVEDDPTGEIPVLSHADGLQAASLELGPAAVLAQVNDFIDDRPSEAAQLLRMWAEERHNAEQGATAQ